MKIKINNFDEISFDEIDPNDDEFLLPDGSIFKFSDHVCHVCWDGGTVAENKNDKSLYCMQCKKVLTWINIEYKLPDEKEVNKDKFLLPKDWTEKEFENWKREFLKIRIGQIVVRENILNTDEGGLYI
ncbi:MAG: hypothetical protein KAR38_13635 [Calditrichia bacterium]|nr:hypothetical protein [Calditrichia bacterium]